MVSAHIIDLKYSFRYHSPPGRYHAPRVITPLTEELEIMVSGKAEFILNGKPQPVGPGSVVWYYAGEVVEVTADAEDPYNTIVFSFSTTGSEPRLRRPPHSVWLDTRDCARFCFEAMDYFNLGAVDKRYYASCLYARFVWESCAAERTPPKGKLDERLERAIAHIDAHFDGDLAIADIAKAAGLSEPHLHLLFRSALGTSPIQMVIRRRLNRALELLSSTSLPVKEVCFEAGFSDLNNFCKYFKAHTGLTPSRYRGKTEPRPATRH